MRVYVCAAMNHLIDTYSFVIVERAENGCKITHEDIAPEPFAHILTKEEPYCDSRVEISYTLPCSVLHYRKAVYSLYELPDEEQTQFSRNYAAAFLKLKAQTA